jgi:hypothetical protein
MKYLYVNGDSYPFGYELENSSNITKGEGRFSQLISEKLNLKECNTSKPGTSFRRTFRQTIDYVITRPDMARESYFLICLTSWARADRYEHDNHPNTGIAPFDYIRNIREIYVLQEFLKSKNLNYLFIDSFTGIFKKSTNKKLDLKHKRDIKDYIEKFEDVDQLGGRFWKEIDEVSKTLHNEYFINFGEHGHITEQFITDARVLHRNYLSRIDLNHVLFPNGYSSILDIQISESDFLEEGHPGLKTHKIIADCVLDYIINNNNGLL